MKHPSPATLQKYGITLEEWVNMYERQGGRCAICGREFRDDQRVNTDHKHVPKWKSLPPEERKKYIRGLLCFFCNNKLLPKGATAEKLRSAADYLEKWEQIILDGIMPSKP